MRYNFYTIRIVRRADQGAYSIYWQEFFKFCGVYVLDYVVDEAAENSDFSATDVALLMTGMQKEDMTRLNAGMAYSLPSFNNNFVGGYDTCFRGQIAALMENIDSWLSRHGELANVFEELTGIFIDEDYLHFNFYRHSFLNQMSKEEMLNLADKYVRCYEKLGYYFLEEKEQLRPSPYLQYAMLNCARKANDIHFIRGDAPVFKQEALMYAAAGIASLDAHFTMGLVLAGLAAFSREYLWRDGVQYLRKAIEQENRQRHTAFVCYALGHYLEAERKDAKQAWEMYVLMETIAPDSYRALFKKGCQALYQEEYRKACGIFQEIQARMLQRMDAGWARPLEIEYGYKCNLLIAWIKRVHLDAREDADDLRRRAEFSGDTFRKNHFADSFFGDELDRCCAYMDKKLNSYMIENILHL